MAKMVTSTLTAIITLAEGTGIIETQNRSARIAKIWNHEIQRLIPSGQLDKYVAAPSKVGRDH